MKKLNVAQRRELTAAFEHVFKHEQIKTIKSYLFNRDLLLVSAWGDFQNRKDFVFDFNDYSLTVPFSEIPLSLVLPASFASGSFSNSVSSEDPPKRKGRGAGKKQSKQVTSFALEPDLMAALLERSEREERTVSALIRLAIKHYLECVK